MPWELAGRIALAALLGGIIGGEREYSGQSAGLRTNILVSVGACLFTILSIYGLLRALKVARSGETRHGSRRRSLAGSGFSAPGPSFATVITCGG